MTCEIENSRIPRAFIARVPVCIAAFAMVAVTVRAGADEMIAGDTKHRRVQIVGFEKGILDFRKPNGQFDAVPVWEVDFFQIDSAAGLADFNQAEEYLLKDQPALAVERYERALRIAPDFWPDVVWARLLLAADNAGDAEQSIRAMVHIVETDPVTVAHLLPQNLPPARHRSGDRVLSALDRAARSFAGQQAGLLIDLVRYKSLARMRDPRAQELVLVVATSALPAQLITPRTMEIRMAALDAMIEGGGADRAVEAINRTLAGVPAEFLFDLLLLKSKALLSRAQSQEECFEAALAAMRVAIHDRDDKRVADALLLAARAHERAGLNQDAARLLRECLRKNKAAESTLDEARAALARLSES